MLKIGKYLKDFFGKEEIACAEGSQIGFCEMILLSRLSQSGFTFFSPSPDPV